MIIAIASGKGGTGKTTVAVSLALSLAADGEDGSVTLLDCDVEEPNDHLFLEPVFEREEAVPLLMPVVDPQRCTLCGRCAEVCHYNAIAVVGRQVLIFRELCHACGSCAINCPEGAISEVPVQVGTIALGAAGALCFGHGVLGIGQALAPPIIRALKRLGLRDGALNILDAPPGTACPVVETLRGADFALLVTEPTPFGLHDLCLAVEVARDEMGLPVGVVINKDGLGDQGVDHYCAQESIPVLMRIPFSRHIAEVCARGEPLVQALPEYRKAFTRLHEAIEAEAVR